MFRGAPPPSAVNSTEHRACVSSHFPSPPGTARALPEVGIQQLGTDVEGGDASPETQTVENSFPSHSSSERTMGWLHNEKR